jgi:predicted ester cyclase
MTTTTSSEVVRRTNLEIARAVAERIANSGDFDALDELSDVPRLRDGLQRTRTAFPDLHSTIEWMIADGDMVSCWVSSTGTHLGPWRGLEPTGRPMAMRGSVSFRIREGRIVDFWVCFNGLSVWEQLTDSTPDQVLAACGTSRVEEE